MDELGNWIYIILMVVVAISSLFSSMNKKRRQQQAEIPERDMPETPYQEIPVPFPDPAPAPSSVKKIRPTSSPVTERFRHQPLSSLMSFPLTETSEQTAISQVTDDEYVLVDDLDLTDTESVRKAVIYSEILKLKY